MPHTAQESSKGWIASGALPQWIVIDLGARASLRSLDQTFSKKAHWVFSIDASDSGSVGQPQEWRRLAFIDGQQRQARYSVPLDDRARYIRLTVLGGERADSVHLQITADTDSESYRNISPDTIVNNVKKSVTIIMQSCDLWSSQAMWTSVTNRAPGNRPLAGTYDDVDAAVTEARIDQARNAGIDAFQSCWFRQKGNIGQPVVTEFEGVIHALANTARNRNAMRWSLFWDNGNPAGEGVSGVSDFVDHVCRFWTDAYLTRPNYLRLHGRPLIVIGHPDILARQLGGEDAAHEALKACRAMVQRAGAGNPILLANNNGNPSDPNALAARLGFDGVMAYATPFFTGLLPSMTPSSREVMVAHREAWRLRLARSHLPPAQTVSIGYDARIWGAADAWYRLAPTEFATLLREAIAQAAALPNDQIGHDVIFLDNWNEYGEGHFIEPSVAYGHDDLDAIAAVLRNVPPPPEPHQGGQ